MCTKNTKNICKLTEPELILKLILLQASGNYGQKCLETYKPNNGSVIVTKTVMMVRIYFKKVLASEILPPCSFHSFIHPFSPGYNFVNGVSPDVTYRVCNYGSGISSQILCHVVLPGQQKLLRYRLLPSVCWKHCSTYTASTWAGLSLPSQRRHVSLNSSL